MIIAHFIVMYHMVTAHFGAYHKTTNLVFFSSGRKGISLKEKTTNKKATKQKHTSSKSLKIGPAGKTQVT